VKYEWEFGDRAREARKKAGLTQIELAEKMQMTANTISNWENGHTRILACDAYKLARALGVSAGWLVAGEGKNEDRDPED
jgi:transcriptional regulator with XRE-family HTH domain